MRAFLAAVALVALAGCASSPSASEQAVSRAGQGTKGTVIVSTTRSGYSRTDGWLKFNCDSGAHGEIADHRPLVHAVRGVAFSLPVASDPNRRADSPMAQVHVIELPSGRCEFFSHSAIAYGVPAGSYSSMLKTVIVSENRPFSIRFEVRPNVTTYIGSFNVKWVDGKMSYWYEDQYERDLRTLTTAQAPKPAPERRIATVVRW